MRFSIKSLLKKRNQRIRDRQIHRLITEKVVIRAANNELKNTHFKYGYDENFAEAVIKCLERQKR